ncbi:MAG: hypothetical protein WCL16_11250 [bacterium]
MKNASQQMPVPLKRKSLSLSHRGAWGQVIVSAILITIIPALVLARVLVCHFNGITQPPVELWISIAVVVVVITLGYTLLLKYPVSIVRLRHYLRTISSGEIPDQVNLTEDEDDLAAVKHYMELIVKMAEDRIGLLQKNHAVELEAERQRVMVESIGAMCHHVGQPATVISMCLYRLRNNPDPGDACEILTDCTAALNSLSEVLDKLRAVSNYSTEHYMQSSPAPAGLAEQPEARIIKI